MIFVSVGTYKTGFDRLIKEVDRLANKKILKNVMAQVGRTKYAPQFIRYRRFFSQNEMNELMKKSRFMIIPGGTGTISNGLKCGKKIIAVPRLERYDEAINDHQTEITKFLEKQGKILAVYDIKDLENAVKKISKFHPKKTKHEECRIAEIIEKFINKN